MSQLGSSAILETAIGLVLVFFLGAGVCTAVVEAVAGLGQFRAKLLWRTVARWFSTVDDADARGAVSRALSLVASPVGATDEVTAEDKAAGRPEVPAEDGTPKPTAAPDIRTSAGTAPREQFFNALPGIVDQAKVLRRTKTLNREAAIAALGSVFAATDELTPDQKKALLGSLVAKLPDGMRKDAAARAAWIERWFDAEMERLGALYRSRIRWFAGLAALILVGALGLDAIDMATQLYKEPDRRQVLVAAAEAEVAAAAADDDPCTRPGATTTTTATTTTAPEPVPQVRDRLECARNLVAGIEGFQVGRWTPNDFDWGRDMPPRLIDKLIALLGMAISIAAFTAGAPWWYSVLKKLMDARKALTDKT